MQYYYVDRSPLACSMVRPIALKTTILVLPLLREFPPIPQTFLELRTVMWLPDVCLQRFPHDVFFQRKRLPMVIEKIPPATLSSFPPWKYPRSFFKIEKLPPSSFRDLQVFFFLPSCWSITTLHPTPPPQGSM